MERLKTLTTIVYMLAGLLAFELIFLIYQLRPGSFTLWVTVGVIAVSSIYLVSMSLGLLKELKNRDKQ